MKLDKLYQVKDLYITLPSFTLVNEGIVAPDAILVQGYDTRIVSSGYTYGIFCWMGQEDTNPNAIATINLILFTNNYRNVNIDTGNVIISTLTNSDVLPIKDVFGVDAVYMMLIQYPTTAQDYVLGGRGNYVVPLVVNGNVIMNCPPTITKASMTPPSATVVNGYSITATPNDTDLYFPLFVDEHITGDITNSNDFEDIIPPSEYDANYIGMYTISGVSENLTHVEKLPTKNGKALTGNITKTKDGVSNTALFINSLKSSDDLTSYFPFRTSYN